MNLGLSGAEDGAGGGASLEPARRAKRTKKRTVAELFRSWDGNSYHAPDDYPAQGSEIDWGVSAGKEAWR